MYISDYVYIYTAGKKWHRGKLNCVGLVLINAIVSPKNSPPEIASQTPKEYEDQWPYFLLIDAANQGEWLIPVQAGVKEFKWAHQNYL